MGNALVASSANVAMMYVVRIIQGAGLGMIIALVPLYLTEVAPPRQRGFLTGITTFSYTLGYATYASCFSVLSGLADLGSCGWISVGCYHATNLTLSWRLPLALACVPPLLLFIGLFLIPGRHDHAVRKLQLTRSRVASISYLERATDRSMGYSAEASSGRRARRVHPDCSPG